MKLIAQYLIPALSHALAYRLPVTAGYCSVTISNSSTTIDSVESQDHKDLGIYFHKHLKFYQHIRIPHQLQRILGLVKKSFESLDPDMLARPSIQNINYQVQKYYNNDSNIWCPYFIFEINACRATHLALNLQGS